MNTVMTIGALSKETGVPSKTIRFYEEIRIIKQAKRADNGYRVYEQEAVDELKVIKYARSLGLPIEEIKRLMKGCEDGKCEHSSEYISTEIDSYLKLLNGRINQLLTLRKKLTDLKRQISKNKIKCGDKTKYCCNILEQIAAEGGE